MSKTTRLLVAVAMLMTPLLAFGSATAHAAPGYGSTPVASVGIETKAVWNVGQPVRVVVTVSSDADATVGPVQGKVKVYLDGKLIRTLPVTNGSFRVATSSDKVFMIPSKLAPLGNHQLEARLIPDADSAYQGSTATDAFRVVSGKTVPDDGDDDNDGILPEAGGFWLGLLIIALLLLALGAYLVRRRTADER